MASNPDMDVAKLMKRSCPELTDNEAAAYGAPFPNIRYKAGVRRFPKLVPEFKDSPGADISRAARDFFSKNWKGQTFMAVGMQDPVLGAPVMGHLHTVSNTHPLYRLESAGHFVQEWGHEWYLKLSSISVCQRMKIKSAYPYFRDLWNFYGRASFVS